MKFYFLILALLLINTLQTSLLTSFEKNIILIISFRSSISRYGTNLFSFLNITIINLTDDSLFIFGQNNLLLTHVMNITYKMRSTAYYDDMSANKSGASFTATFKSLSELKTVKFLINEIKTNKSDLQKMDNLNKKLPKIFVDGNWTFRSNHLTNIVFAASDDPDNLGVFVEVTREFQFYFDCITSDKNTLKIAAHKDTSHIGKSTEVFVFNLTLNETDEMKEILNFAQEIWKENKHDIFGASVKKIKYTPDSKKKKFYPMEILVIIEFTFCTLGIIIVILNDKLKTYR